MNSFLDELSVKRGNPYPGSNPVWFIELEGGQVIEPTAFEPDPNTHRQDYYYNAVTNVLYKKVITSRNPIIAHWKKASN